MNVFISGGCKNGKSMYAQEVAREMALAEGRELYYLATMIPADQEDRVRIKRHLAERHGWGFKTLEAGRNIGSVLDQGADLAGVFLLDSVTALLSNEMFRSDGSCDLDAGKRVADELSNFAQRTGNTIFVSDYIYSEAKVFDEYTEMYRRGLSYIDRQLAEICGEVIEVAYGHRYYHKERGKA